MRSPANPPQNDNKQVVSKGARARNLLYYNSFNLPHTHVGLRI